MRSIHDLSGVCFLKVTRRQKRDIDNLVRSVAGEASLSVFRKSRFRYLRIKLN